MADDAQPRRILVVDDEPSIVDSVSTSLRYEGFDVDEATTGRTALAMAQDRPPDLIVLDVMLPDLDGLEVTRRLRADGIRTPVLFLTARDALDDKLAGLTIGGDDYVTKPFSLAEVIARIRVILRRALGDEQDDGVLRFADLEMDEALHSFLYSRTDQSLQQTAGSLPPGLGGSGAPGGVPQPGISGTGPSGQVDQPPPAVQADAPGVSVEVRKPDGTVVASYPGHQQGGKAYSPKLPAHITGFSRASASVPSEVFFTTSSTAPGGPQVRVLAVRQEDGDILVLGVSLANTVSTLDRLVSIELLVTGAALVAAVLLGLWLVRLGLRPLTDVEATATRIAAGKLEQRMPGESDRTEVGRLARTLNVMLSRIERAFAERDATEAELRQSEERLRRFVADASHELRTPLAAVSAYAELFDRGAREHPEDLGRVMTGIQGETSRMGRLVEDLLLLARLDEGRPPGRGSVDLAALAADAVQTAATVGPAWPVSLEVDQPARVVGDEAGLRQVLDNLLANVRAHTPEGTGATVRVTGGVQAGEAVVEVADRGPGVGEEAGRIFERFYRSDPSRARAHGGTGLGLSIVAAIVAAHGGHVAAADRPGGGTVVTVHLPVGGDRHGSPGLPDVPADETNI